MERARLSQARIEKGWSQEYVASSLGVDRITVQRQAQPPLAPMPPVQRCSSRLDFLGNRCRPHHMVWWGKNAAGQILMRRNGRGKGMGVGG